MTPDPSKNPDVTEAAVRSATTRPQTTAEAYPVLRFFDYEHLPQHLQQISKPIGDLARAMAEQLPRGAETAAGLRKLLEAKDCLVRANLPNTIPARG